MKKIVLALGLLLLGYLAPVSQASAAGQLICYEVSSLVCQPVSVATPLPVNASVTASISGFQPSASGARGTPVTVTTSDSSGTLPTGAVVLVSNPGANLMYCNVNGVAATTSDEPITSGGGWFAFTIPATITTLHCIATGGSTTANMVGGSGLPTGTGGGGGSGGGGAITAAAGSYSAGAFVAGTGVDGWDLTQGTKGDALATSSTASWSVIALLKGIYAQLVLAVSAINSAIPAGVNLIGNTGQVYPAGSTPITVSNTGTTGATTATLAANASLHTYICGFSIRANAAAAATGNATVTGMVTGTTNWTQWTAPNTSGLGVTEEVFSPCVISSAINTGIAVISAAPGTSGIVSVSAWGYQL